MTQEKRLRLRFRNPEVIAAVERISQRLRSTFVEDCVLRVIKHPEARKVWAHALGDGDTGPDEAAQCEARPPLSGSRAEMRRPEDEEPGVDLSFLGDWR